ncbi:uncharacterized protein LOC107397740 [Tribolium castaneum]|uniref:uncharacterized protein LOC107397740 n=1 Tax=Tribolium castaneum TaxID=7070 RepID=UPI0030FE6168
MTMQFIVKRATRDDLRVLKFISSDIFDIKIMKLCLFITFLIHLTACAITIHAFMFNNFSRREFISCAPVLFGCFYGLLGLGTILFKPSMTRTLMLELKAWDITAADDAVSSRIKFEINVITVFCLVNYLLALVASFFYYMSFYGDEEIFYLIRFLEDHCPNHKRVLIKLYKISFVLLGYVMVVHACQVLYATQHVRFQLILCAHFMANVTKQAKNIKDEHLPDDNNYQNMIRERLKFCIIRHQEIRRFYFDKLEEMGNLIGGFALLGCFLGISFAMHMLTSEFLRYHFARTVSSIIAGVTTFATVIAAGQSVETEVDISTRVVKEVKWYTFNESNKRSYMLMLLNSMQTYKIKFSENYSINYELGLSIVRGVFSIVSVVVQLDY